MLIAYDSKTGNVSRFVNKLDMDCLQIKEDCLVSNPFILITYTTGLGEVPTTTQIFLKNNYQYLRGVASSGNRNWGSTFCKSANIIKEQYGVPILLKFELSGTPKDIEIFKRRVQEIVKMD